MTLHTVEKLGRTDQRKTKAGPATPPTRPRTLQRPCGVDAAADLLWLYTSHELYRMLVIERKWSTDRYRAWLRAATASIRA